MFKSSAMYICVVCCNVNRSKHVYKCAILFKNRTLLKIGRNIFNLLLSLKDNDNITALFGLKPILDKEIHGNYDTFYKHEGFFYMRYRHVINTLLTFK